LEATERAKHLVDEQRKRAPSPTSPAPRRKRGRWDDAPADQPPAAPSGGKWEEDPSERTSAHFDATPVGNIGLETPLPAASSSSFGGVLATPGGTAIDPRNRYKRVLTLGTCRTKS
jgi:splicing factor 3B subunit 1